MNRTDKQQLTELVEKWRGEARARAMLVENEDEDTRMFVSLSVIAVGNCADELSALLGGPQEDVL